MARTRNSKRASMEEIEAMPALLTTAELAYITGWTRLHVSRECREGLFSDLAVKSGNSWTINKAKALDVLGLA